MTTRFEIGDFAWHAAVESEQKKIACPDCLGSGAITVIMGNGDTVSVECSLCSWGYEGAHGYVTYYEKTASVRRVMVDRVEQTADKIEYGVDGLYRTENLFQLREDAERKAQELADELNRGELARIQRKEKDTKSWAWNARYHRECIRRAEKDLEYHSKKLAVAKIKAKEKEEA